MTTRILLISGSLRSASTNAALLRAAAETGPAGTETTIYEGLDALPHFNPDLDLDPAPATVVALRDAIADADAVLFSTPEYAGALPGSFKNLFDWVVGGGQLHEKPVAWVNVSATSGAAKAHAELRTVLGYLGAHIVDPACLHLPVRRDSLVDGDITDPMKRAAAGEVLAALAEHVAEQRETGEGGQVIELRPGHGIDGATSQSEARPSGTAEPNPGT